MDSCEIDSEFMNQFAAAQAIPDTTQFKVVCDENNEPMVFSLGNKIGEKQDPSQRKPIFNPTRFNLLKKDASGQYKLIDFGLKLGFPADYKGDAINVSQHVESKTLFIALSTSTLSKNSDLHLLKPVKPQELNTADLKSLLMSPGSKKPSSIVDIFIGSPPDADTYPPVFLTYAVLDRLIPTKDVARISVNNSGGRWSWELGGGFELPTNPDKVLALTPVVYKWRGDPANGVAALWETNNILELAVISFDGETTVSLSAPDGSSALSTVASSYGYTHLLVGGTNLWYYMYNQLLNKHSKPTKLLTDKAFDSANQLHVTQSTSEVAIWAESSQKGISYVLTEPDLKNPKAPVQLIPDGAGGHFAAFKATQNATEHFVIASDSGQLSVLKQNPVTKFWQEVPLAAPDLNWTIEFQSYVTHVLVKGADKRPLLNHPLHLCSSVPQDILVNGRATHTYSDPVTVKTDSRGYLILSNPTDDISSATFTVSEAPQVVASANSIDIVPRKKIDDHLSKIKTGADLRNARLQNGDKLITDKITDLKLDQAASAISHFVSVGKPTSMLNLHPVAEGESRVVAGWSEDGGDVEAFDWWDDALDVMKEAWHAFVHTGQKIGKWILKQVIDGYHLFVQLGTAAYKWVVKTAEEAWKGIYWVFEKILNIAKKIIDWIGFIFDWADIQKTHRSIVHITKGLLETVPNYVDSMTEKVNSFFDKLEASIDAWGRIPSDVSVKKAGPSSVESDSRLSSTKVNWAITQFHHAGACGSRTSEIKPSSSPDPIQAFWSQTCVGMGNQYQNDIQSIGYAFKDLNLLSSSASLADVMKKIAVDLIRRFIQALRTAATQFLSILKTIVKDFNDVITATIDIPIFSWLYKKFLSGGSDLSLLDGLALVVAIPTTILFKIISGSAPPDMTRIDYDKLINGGLSEKEMIQFSHFGGITTIFSEVLVGIVDVIEAFIPSAHSQQWLASDVATKLSIWQKILMYIKDGFAIMGRAFGIPLDTNLPAYEIRWASWSLACVNCSISAAIRRVVLKEKMKQEEMKQVKRILAVIEGVLGTVNYGLIITIKVKEYEDVEYRKKYGKWTIMDILSGTFDEIALICDDIAHWDPDLDTKAALEGINLTFQALSYVLQGIQFEDKHEKQIYFCVLNKIN